MREIQQKENKYMWHEEVNFNFFLSFLWFRARFCCPSSCCEMLTSLSRRRQWINAMHPEALLLPFIQALHKMPKAPFGSVNHPNRGKCPRKEPFPQLKKIRGTIREKRLFPAPVYWQTHKATQLQGLEQKASSPLTFLIQIPAFLFTVLSPPHPEIGWNGVPVADACNFRALLHCWWVASGMSLPPVRRRKVTWRTVVEEPPHCYLRAIEDRTNISPHCHKSY